MRQAFFLIVILALLGGGYYLLTPEGRELIDRITVYLTRTDYQARFRAGELLPGTPDLDHFDQRLGGERREARRAGLYPHLQARIRA